LVASKGNQPIEIVGTVKEFGACFAKPCLSSQVSQDFSRVTVFLHLSGRRKIFDHVDFPQSADQAETTHLRQLSSNYRRMSGSRTSTHKTGVAVRQVHRKKVDLALGPRDLRQRLAKNPPAYGQDRAAVARTPRDGT
jgi:hypothetical protein